MARPFAKISFTPDVKAVQSAMGSRTAYQAAESGPVEQTILGVAEQTFIAARDSVYLATVGQTGWPYVQHRGGPAGFLKVVDERTIGFADFSGNRQYLSVGNLRGDDRVSLLLMDYPQRRRLKIWGRARLVDAEREPALLAQLELADFRAPVERGIVIQVEAFDWNCPKYITPRYSQAEVERLLAEARQAPPVVMAPSAPEAAVGSGPWPLTVVAMRQLTPDIRSYELRHADGLPLTAYGAGAHLNVPVALADGSVTMRCYSLTDGGEAADCYRIAVQRLADGEGGSQAIHAGWQLGTRIKVEAPANHFPLHDDERPALLIAGGIGITPLKAMAETLARRGVSFQLHYVGRTRTQMAFVDELQRSFSQQCHIYCSRDPAAATLDVASLLGTITADTLIYVCGPSRLLDSVRQAARHLGIADWRLQFESFV